MKSLNTKLGVLVLAFAMFVGGTSFVAPEASAARSMCHWKPARVRAYIAEIEARFEAAWIEYLHSVRWLSPRQRDAQARNLTNLYNAIQNTTKSCEALGT